MVVDGIRDKVVGRPAIELDDNMRKAIDEIRSGKNIHTVLADAKVPRAEMHKFFSNQYRQWKVQIIQDSEAYAAQDAVREPVKSDFHEHNPENSFKPGDGGMLLEGMFGKAMNIGGKVESLLDEDVEGAEDVESVGEGPMTQSELEGYAQRTLDEWDNVMGDLWQSVLDQQFVKDYENRMAEIQQEVQRIIALVKEGKVGPEFALIALAKVNAMKNGALMAWMGKKSFAINEEMSRSSEALQNMDASDPGYFAALQGFQADTREGSFNLNMLTNDMQKVMQNVQSTLETVHGMMGEINRSRREIIARVSATG